VTPAFGAQRHIRGDIDLLVGERSSLPWRFVCDWWSIVAAPFWIGTLPATVSRDMLAVMIRCIDSA
jgi:hypothetical protein